MRDDTPGARQGDAPDRGGDDSLTETLEALVEASRDQEESDGEVKLGDLLEALAERGFGPILIALASFLILPVGMIPGVPALVGALMMVMAAQMLAGRSSPWLPKKLGRFEIPADKVEAGVEKMKPFSRRAGKLFRPRIAAAARSPVGPRLAAIGTLISGATAIPLGFIPMLPLLLSVPVLCFGVALTARDGLAMLVGIAAYAPAGWALYAQLA